MIELTCIVCIALSSSLFTYETTGETMMRTQDAPDIDWMVVNGTVEVEWGHCIQQTSDGGYVVTGAWHRGWWNPWPGYFYTAKFYSNGSEEWTYLHGSHEIAYTGNGVIEDEDGSIISIGDRGYATLTNLIMIKNDAEGNFLWEKLIGGSLLDSGKSIKRTSDGGFIIVGNTMSYGTDGSSDVWLVKTDANGNELWNKSFGDSYTDMGYDLEVTADNGFILAGAKSDEEQQDMYVVKTDANGNIQWDQTYGDINAAETAYSIKKTYDGGYIIAGSDYDLQSWYSDVILLKIDSSGTEIWNKTYGGAYNDEGYCVETVSDSGFVITGTRYVDDSNSAVYVIRTDDEGTVEWEQTISQDGNSDNVGNYIVQTQDYGFVLTGYTGNPSIGDLDLLIIKFVPEEQFQGPTAHYTWVDADGASNPGTIIDVDASASIGPNPIILYEWDWTTDGTYDYADTSPFASHDYGDELIHECTLRVTDNMAKNNTYSDVVQANNVEVVDIDQSIFDRGMPMRHTSDGDWGGAQNYTSTYDTVTKVEIYLRKMGAPEFDLTVELRLDGPQATLLDTVVVPIVDVPTSWTWLAIDFANTIVGAGSDVFIVCPPAPSGVTTSYGYEWGYALGNQYDGGAFWFTRNGGGLWRDLPTMYEYCFRTYGYS